jgi:hypothetical protein
MDPIFPQHVLILPGAPIPVAMAPVSAIPALWQQDRIARLTALAPEDAAAGLLWLAMNFPAVTDAMLDKAGYDAIDDPDPGREPEPFCAECGADIGIFLRFGLDWRHYRGDGTTIGQIELLDPGHQPVVAWRLGLRRVGSSLAGEGK